MLESFRRRYLVDDTQVFVLGLSAGGAMTAALLAIAPETFNAGAVFGAGPFRCAETLDGATACREGNVTHSPEGWAELVTERVDHPGRWPRLFTLHGREDSVVDATNADALAAQFATLNGLSFDDGAAHEEANGVARARWHDAEGDVRVERVYVEGLGHAVPVDPPRCGAVGLFQADVGLCGMREAFDFFGLRAGGEP